MKLFHIAGTCSLSPHIALLEAGIPFELCRVDRETKRVENVGDYNQINTKGSVPAIQLDDGRVLTEGSAIVQYIADQAPSKNLAPKPGTFERYQLQEMLNFIASDIHKGYSPLFHAKLPDDVRKAFADRLSSRIAWAAKRLEKQPYLMGEHFTVADGYLFTVLGWSKHTKIDLSQWPSIQAFMARISERPAVAAALKADA